DEGPVNPVFAASFFQIRAIDDFQSQERREQQFWATEKREMVEGEKKEEDEKIHYNYSLHFHHRRINLVPQVRLETSASVGPTLKMASSNSPILKNANWEAKPNQFL
ncbi:hypothetical protein M8C21_032611, partial [Ambrosia artemisiifolia]